MMPSTLAPVRIAIFLRRISSYSLTPEKFEKGVRLYLEEGFHVRVEDGHLAPEDVTMIDADCIVQFALFGEVRYS